MNTKYIPCLFTLTNLLFGVLSLVYTMAGDFQLAAIMVLFSMVLDAMDGRLARRLDAASPFGKELDSLADLVSFGVAPAIMVYAAKLQGLGPHGFLGLALALAFSLCGAIRLARFNVLNISTYFVGVPITAAGSLMALLILLSNKLPLLVYPVAMVILSFLMVSNIKVPKY
ncbi:CDP-diacylglycerol--serine O-phosphatidyltransferase [Thermincola potens]|uniref:CDP-diacylglycerol--serine O-phosphatidyltransferase n=1 Tax=Thermincola potens (strain JR) TaxID=635013 RepID=D5X886_THEPJ|nr:CDP-diacylglycerol--serine O-phosphatidyltransferase [Thermincola potens]ADG82806.1 CDP-diacylglycerol/serine O-phosphatidyltransferase [Thermincola potens JR]